MFTGDWTELHTNTEYSEGEDGPYDARIAQGPMTFILSTGLFQRTGIVERTVVAFLGMNYMDIPNPVYIGDTVSAVYEIQTLKDLDSRDDAGYVEVDCKMTNQDGESVFEGDMKFLFKTKS
jgi:acyl dehydratase